MKTILVPVDFSKTSIHAAKYALRLAEQLGDCRLLLLHVVRVGYYETILPSVNYTQYGEKEIQQLHDQMVKKLYLLKDKLQSFSDSTVIVDMKLEEGRLSAIINETNEQEHPFLTVIGSNGGDDREDKSLGNNTINIAKTSTVPVLVVPPTATYHRVNNVLLACDFKKITETMPVEDLKGFIKTFGATLQILNVHPKGDQPSEDILREQDLFTRLLDDIKHSYHFTREKSITRGVLDFAKDSKAEIIVSLPKRYSFVESMIRESVSARITYTSDKPVLLLRAK